MKLIHRLGIGAIALVAVGGSIAATGLGASASSTHPPGHTRPALPGQPIPPAPPRLNAAHKMMLVGRNGKPIIGKSGRPIMVTVGGPPPALPQPGSARFKAIHSHQKPLSAAQRVAATGPVEITIPQQSDQQKAEQLAPNQAVVP